MIYSVKTRDKDGRRLGGICPEFDNYIDMWNYIKEEYKEVNDEHFVFQVWLINEGDFTSNIREIIYGDNDDIIAIDKFLKSTKGKNTRGDNFSVSIFDETLKDEDWCKDLTTLFDIMVRYKFKSKDKDKIKIIIRYHKTNEILHECDYWDMMLIARYLYYLRDYEESIYNKRSTFFPINHNTNTVL